MNIYLNGFTQMTPDEVAKSIGAAAAAWGPDQVTCPTGTGDAGSGHPSFQIIPQFATGGSVPEPAPDGNNTIVFQTDPDSMEFPPGALAYTKVWWQPNGNIVDADIQINAIPGGPEAMPNLLANLDPGSPPEQHAQARIDLQTLMTHEFGHFLGLAHTCWSTDDDNGDQPPDGSKDDRGQLIPTCMQYPDSSEAVQATAVMWYEVASESTAKRVLTTDDARGVCGIYPSARSAPTCAQNAPDDGCGCAASGEGSGSALAAALVGLALVAARRRRNTQA